MTIKVDHITDTLIISTNTLTMSASGALKLPSGNTAARPGSPVAGMLRYNSDTLTLEAYQNSSWTAASIPNNTISSVSPAWGFSSDNNIDGAFYRYAQNFTTTPITPAISLSATLDLSSAVALDFIGAAGGTIMPGIYVQHIQSGGSASTNAFSHSIMGYAVNSSLGDNDVVGVSGRVRKTNVVGGIGDAAGMWGSAYQSSSQNGGVMGLEGHIYQNVSGTTASDTLGSKWSVALHLRSDSTGSPATAGVAMTGAAGGGSGYGVWNGMIMEKNLWAGAATAGTVGINCGDWNSSYHPEVGIKFGTAGTHISRTGGSLIIGSPAIRLNGNNDEDCGVRINARGTGIPYIDFLDDGVLKSNIFWDVTATSAVWEVNDVPVVVFEASVTGGDGGDVSVTASPGTGTNSNGGNLTLTAGAKTGTGTAGVINLVIPATGALQINGSAGTSGYVLTSQGAGAAPIWAAGGGSGTPGGSNTQIQFNDSGSFGGDADFTWNKTSNVLTITGNLVFSGDTRKIQGDFSNSTASNRTLFQTSTTNANTSVNVVTNGTGTVSSVGVCNGSDIDNAASVQIISGTTGINGVNSFKRGTGTTRQIDFAIDGVSKLAVGTGGDVLIGGTSAGTSGQVFTSGGSGAPPTWSSSAPEASAITITMTNGNGSTINKGDVVYVSAASTVSRGDADTTGTSTPVIGVVFDTSIANAASGKICTHGKVTGLSGLTAGATYYLSQTPGQPTSTPPSASGTWVVPIGIALSTTELLVNVGTPIQN